MTQQKIIAYVVASFALGILLSSTARISILSLGTPSNSNNRGFLGDSVNFDIQIDDDNVQYADGEDFNVNAKQRTFNVDQIKPDYKLEDENDPNLTPRQRRRRKQRNIDKAAGKISGSGGNSVGIGIVDAGRDPRVENAELYRGPILPINQRSLAVSNGESGPEGVSDVLPGLYSMASQARKLTESKLPYKCGVILYDQHIPGEGGEALNNWIKELVDSNSNNNNNNERAIFLSNEEQESRQTFINKVEEQIKNVGPTNWKIIDSHGLAFATGENILKSWRDTVERQNCQFVAAAIFSDPLDHSIKRTKDMFAKCQCSMERFKDMIMGVNVQERWKGQLDSFLFNHGRDGAEMEMKDKVKRGIQLLKEHFEVAGIDGKLNFAEEVLRITGWKSRSHVKEVSVSDGGLVYSKDLVSKFGKISAKNGDADFIDAVNHVYHNSLGFLMLQ